MEISNIAWQRACEICEKRKYCNGISCTNMESVENMAFLFNEGEDLNEEIASIKDTIITSAPYLFIYLGEYFKSLGYSIDPDFAISLIKLTASEDWHPELISSALVAMIAKNSKEVDEVYIAGKYFFKHYASIIKEQQLNMDSKSKPSKIPSNKSVDIVSANGISVEQYDLNKLLAQIDEQYGRIVLGKKNLKKISESYEYFDNYTDNILNYIKIMRKEDETQKFLDEFAKFRAVVGDGRKIIRSSFLGADFQWLSKTLKTYSLGVNLNVNDNYKQESILSTPLWFSETHSLVEKIISLQPNILNSLKSIYKDKYTELIQQGASASNYNNSKLNYSDVYGIEESSGQYAEIPSFIDTVTEIIKRKSKKHRPIFTKGKKAVKSESEGELLNTPFQRLNNAQKQAVKKHISAHAKAFRTKFTHNMRTNHRARIDIASTCKKACATDGIPIRLDYTKPKNQKNNIIMILDVSGSCSNASEIMLTFMHYMRQSFPAGYKAYAFTNVLYDITDDIKQPNPDKTIEQIMNRIPRAGAYSNYNTPLNQFYHNHLGKVNKDSIVFFIGDARNNKNATGEKYMKAISRKCKKCYWLNTEHYSRWNQADSIINVYAPYCDSVVQTTTPAELLTALTTL